MVAEQEKKKRTVDKSAFSKSLTKLNKLFDADASLSLVTEQFEKVKSCFERLEDAHNEFLMATDIDIENDPAGLAYMTESDEKYETALDRYARYQKTVEQEQSNNRKTLEK